MPSSTTPSWGQQTVVILYRLGHYDKKISVRALRRFNISLPEYHWSMTGSIQGHRTQVGREPPGDTAFSLGMS